MKVLRKLLSLVIVLALIGGGVTYALTPSVDIKKSEKLEKNWNLEGKSGKKSDNNNLWLSDERKWKCKNETDVTDNGIQYDRRHWKYRFGIFEYLYG